MELSQHGSADHLPGCGDLDSVRLESRPALPAPPRPRHPSPDLLFRLPRPLHSRAAHRTPPALVRACSDRARDRGVRRAVLRVLLHDRVLHARPTQQVRTDVLRRPRFRRNRGSGLDVRVRGAGATARAAAQLHRTACGRDVPGLRALPRRGRGHHLPDVPLLCTRGWRSSEVRLRRHRSRPGSPRRRQRPAVRRADRHPLRHQVPGRRRRAGRLRAAHRRTRPHHRSVLGRRPHPVSLAAAAGAAEGRGAGPSRAVRMETHHPADRRRSTHPAGAFRPPTGDVRTRLPAPDRAPVARVRDRVSRRDQRRQRAPALGSANRPGRGRLPAPGGSALGAHRSPPRRPRHTAAGARPRHRRR